MTQNNFSYESSFADVGRTGYGGNDQAAADLSRSAWDCMSAPLNQAKLTGPIHTDQSGRITQVNNPDGSTYDYSGFRANGQPSEVKITDHKTGDWGQWKREEDGLWRSYHKDKPDYQVVRGEWVVDDKGVMHMQGVQDTKELPPTIKHDAEGHITKVSRPDGSVYDYSKFDQNGQPTVCRITDTKTGDWGYWKKEDDHLWRSYDKEKPNYEVLRGDWTVDKNGTMHMNGVQDSIDPPKVRPAAERPHVAPIARKIGPGPNGVPGRAPDGYQPLRGHISPEVAAEAKSLLHGDWGTETPFEANGKRYMARVEPHYHPPGFKGGPNGWHKGVTVYDAKPGT
jgi:hypothetical protein